MSFAADGGLVTIQPTGSESRRAVTPSKLFTRQVTPQRAGSAGRSHSNNRERFTSDIHQDPHVLRSGSDRPISVRRQRRWENKNLFGLEEHSKSKEDRILEALEHADLAKEGIPFEVSWRSTLSELLKPSNHQLLHDFLSCKENLQVRNKTQRAPESLSDWEVAESAWLSIEKRIRAAIVRSFTGSEVIRLFLTDLERVYQHFARTGQALSADGLCDELKKELSQPIAVDKAGNLVVPLRDSAFRRLLAHGVAQFYSLQSDSVKLKGQQDKACLVKAPRRAATPEAEAGSSAKSPAKAVPQAVARALSLVRFLALRCQQGLQADAEGDGAAQAAGHQGPSVTGPAAAPRTALAEAHYPAASASEHPVSRALPAPWSHPHHAALHSLQRRLARLRITPATGDKQDPAVDEGRLDVSLVGSLSQAASSDAAAATRASPSGAAGDGGESALRLDSFDCVLVENAQESPFALVQELGQTEGQGRQGRASSTESDEYVVVPR